MKVFGNLNIKETFMVDSKDYEGGVLRVDDDAELRNIVGTDDGEVALTLHDGLLNVYYIETDDWIKWYSWLIPAKEDYTLIAEESELTFTDGDAPATEDINFYLPSASGGLIYTFVKTKYSEFYDFNIVPYSGDYINDINDTILSCSSEGINVVTLVAINSQNWIVTGKRGIWIYV